MAIRATIVEIVVRMSGIVLPRWVLRAAYSMAVGHRHVALCLHRVGLPGLLAPLPWASVTAARLDELIGMIDGHHRHHGSTLTLTFDDGYRDSVDYVTRRAPGLAHVDWVLFVCPEKIRSRAGFRWDLYELERMSGSPHHLDTVMSTPLGIAVENRREELLALGDHDAFELATVADLLAAAAHPNVRIGNHSNNHFRFIELSDHDAEQEIRGSAAALDELVGTHADFAFPFGSPRTSFSERDIEMLRSCCPAVTIWSTEARPYSTEERTSGAVLPRIPHFGDWTAKRMLAFMTYCASSDRVRRRWRRRPGQRPMRARADLSAS